MADTNLGFVEKLKRVGYKQNLKQIKLCRESYDGGLPYINEDNLFSHPREKSDEYHSRLKRAYYYNFVAPVVDIYSDFLFKGKVSRISKGSNVGVFIENCDIKGTKLDTYMKNVSAELIKVGQTFVVVDSPSDEVQTKAEEIASNKRPYVYTIKTEDVLDLEEDDDGIVWIKYNEVRSTKDGKWDYEGDGEKKVFVIWSRELYLAYDTDGKLIDSLVNTIGVVPIVHIKLRDGEPLIKDTAIVNRAIFNWCSLLDEIIYRQTFSWLVVPGDSSEGLSDKKIGISSMFTFNPDSKHMPGFISPDAAQGELIAKNIEKGIQTLYKLANLEWAFSVVQESGVAKAYDFMNINKTLTRLAIVLENGEKSIYKMYAKYYGVDIDYSDKKDNEYEVTVEYPREFASVALADKLSQVYEALGFQISKKFNELLRKQMVDLLLPTITQGDKETVYEEIEELMKNEDFNYEISTSMVGPVIENTNTIKGGADAVDEGKGQQQNTNNQNNQNTNTK